VKEGSHLCPRHGLTKSSGSTSCGIHWVSPVDLASSSRPALVVPPNSPKNSDPEPLPVHPPPTQSPQDGTSIHQEKPRDQSHSCSYCASCVKFQDDLANLQDLVFEVCGEVDNLRFHLEILDKKGMQIMQMLSSLQGTQPSRVQTPSFPVTSMVVLVMALQTPTVDNSVVVLDSTLQAPTKNNSMANNEQST
jgi:hypothetical protein